MARRTMDTVQDGIITGQVTKVRKVCGYCGAFIRCIQVDEVEMPEGVELGWTKIALRDPDGKPIEGEHLTYIGIGCGDYAEFHRQVKSIQLKRLRKGLVKT